jgi:hypothetical protein
MTPSAPSSRSRVCCDGEPSCADLNGDSLCRPPRDSPAHVPSTTLSPATITPGCRFGGRPLDAKVKMASSRHVRCLLWDFGNTLCDELSPWRVSPEWMEVYRSFDEADGIGAAWSLAISISMGSRRSSPSACR